MKVYRRHRCDSRHRTWGALARCIWPRAEWISGVGPYATVAYCRVTTVELHRDEQTARAALATINGTACGGRCYRDHELIVLAPGWDIAPTTPRSPRHPGTTAGDLGLERGGRA